MIKIVLALSFLISPAYALCTPTMGMTELEVHNVCGLPLKRDMSAGKSIETYEGLQLIYDFRNGQMVLVQMVLN